MRFRVWLIFMGFTTIILGFLYVNQVLLLPNYYNFLKTQETTGTANVIKKYWDEDTLATEIYRMAREHEMRITVTRYIGNAIVSTITADPDNLQQRITVDEPENDILLDELFNSTDGTVTNIMTIDERQLLHYTALVGTRSDVRGIIVIYNFMQPFGNTQDILQSQFFLSSSVVLIVAFILSLFIVSSVSNPIAKISKGTQKLAKGEFNMNTKRADYAEIKTLTENLNKASYEISKTENLRKDLLANISHDLKTPLTMIRAYAEMIRDLSGDNPEKRSKHVQVIIDEADRLNGLVIDMLDLSKIQSGVAKKNLTFFNFSMHLGEVLPRFDYLSQEHGVVIVPEIEPNILIKADVPKIEQVVYNLINNAVNYTGDDGKITVRLIRKKAGIGRFEVKDSGGGIAKEEIPYIWERYYKAAKAQFHKRTTVGTGIGLSIVKGVMEIHGYAYGVNSALGKGSTFWFDFPCE
jgi:signal transduction histidine kinase